jgi:hypothetical protein
MNPVEVPALAAVAVLLVTLAIVLAGLWSDHR